MIPFCNAALTAINAGGTAEDYDTPAGAGAPRWSGNIGIYVAEELHQAESGGNVDELVTTRLELPYTVGALVQRGDTLVYAFEGATHQRIARNLIRAELVGRVRVTLETS